MRAPVHFETRGGAQFARCAIALALANGVHTRAAQIARERWPGDQVVVECLKTAVPAGTTGASGWADTLSAFGIAPEFVTAVRAATVIDRLPGVRRVPFKSRVPVELSPAGAGWVAEGKSIPVSRSVLSASDLEVFKAATIITLDAEILKIARPGNEDAVLAALVAAVASFLDERFLQPAYAAVAGESPAAITRGAPQIITTGASAAQIADDLSDMIDAITTDFTSPVWVMPPRTAARMAALGVDRDLKIAGGTLFGIPVLTTRSARPAGSPSIGFIVLLDAADVLLADEGRADVLASEAASIELLDNPTNESGGSTAATTLTSMYQTLSTAFRVTREINWARAHDGSVAYMETGY